MDPDFPLPAKFRKRRLRTEEASEYLEIAHGVTIAPKTLATHRVRGGGPEFVKFGRCPLYERTALDAWVEARLSQPMTSTN